MDEAHGSWGQMGTEIACKAWLSGGRLVCNKRTWFAHLFRTQGGDFGFPYPNPGSAQEVARKHSRDLWRNNRWPGQVYPLGWLLRRFWPIPEWTPAQLYEQQARDRTWLAARGSDQAAPAPPNVSGNVPGTIGEPFPNVGSPAPVSTGSNPVQPGLTGSKGVVFYTDGRLDRRLLTVVIRQLLKATDASQLPIVCVGLAPTGTQHPRWTEHVYPAERGTLTMFRQILTALELLDTDVAYLCEHDVLYAPDHFVGWPSGPDVYRYNQHTWKVDTTTGRALHYRCNQTSGLSARRLRLVEHYRARVARVERDGFTRRMGFEPGTHRTPRGVDDYGHEIWMSERPNVDLRHATNLTASRWRQEEFRDQRFCQGWTEADGVPGWGLTRERFDQWLAQLGV